MDDVKFKPRIDLKNRTKLEEVLPLKAPYVIFIDPSDACNFKCSFCPTGDPSLMRDVGRPLQQMTWETYKKTIDELSQFQEKIRVIRLYKDGEPLLNKRLPDMIEYAKKSDLSKFSKFHRGMLEHGIYLAPSQFEAGFTSLAHTDEDIDQTLAAAKEVMSSL